MKPLLAALALLVRIPAAVVGVLHRPWMMCPRLIAQLTLAVLRAEWEWRAGKVAGFRLQVLCYAAQQVLDAERAEHIAQIQRTVSAIGAARRRCYCIDEHVCERAQ